MYMGACLCMCAKEKSVVQRETDPLHSGVSLILEVNGQPADGIFNLLPLIGPLEVHLITTGGPLFLLL